MLLPQQSPPGAVWLRGAVLGRAYHQGQDEGPDLLPDLRRNVVAELLEGGEEALQLAELPGTAGGGELLVGQGGGGGGGRAVAEPLGGGRCPIERRGGMVYPVGHCKAETKALSA